MCLISSSISESVYACFGIVLVTGRLVIKVSGEVPGFWPQLSNEDPLTIDYELKYNAITFTDVSIAQSYKAFWM